MDAINLQGVSKHFKSFSLGKLSFTLPEGSVMGLIGENGSGKTTLLKLILNSLHKDEGCIEVFGKGQDKDFYKLKEDIGVVMETASFSPFLNAVEVEKVMSGIFRNWDREEYYSYLKKFSIPEKTKFKELSKGSKMKLYIAVALSHKAKLLILDEPTSGLDPVAREDFLDIIWNFTRDEHNTVLISSHIVSDLEKICDYITFLHQGKIILSYEKDKLIESFGTIQCTEENFKELDGDIIIGSRKSPYGVEALIDKRKAPDLETNPASLEEIFVYMVKGDN